MGLFRKKEVKKQKQEKVPELPQLPELPELPKIEEMHQAKSPSFQDFIASRSIDHETVKQAVSDTWQREPVKVKARDIGHIPTIPKTKEIGSEKGRPGSIEISAWEPQKILPEDQEMKITKPFSKISEPARLEEKPKKTGPVFVRIDKFEDVVSSFHEIKKKVSEIENLLKTVKKIKSKEEEEINEWEAELEKIKSGLDKIDKNLFSGLD